MIGLFNNWFTLKYLTDHLNDFLVTYRTHSINVAQLMPIILNGVSRS